MVNVSTGLALGGAAAAFEASEQRALKREEIGSREVIADKKLLAKILDNAQGNATSFLDKIQEHFDQGGTIENIPPLFVRSVEASINQFTSLGKNQLAASTGARLRAVTQGTSRLGALSRAKGGAAGIEKGAQLSTESVLGVPELEAVAAGGKAKAVAAGTAAGTPPDIAQIMDKTARLVNELMDKGTGVDEVRGILQQLVNANPRAADGLGAIAQSLPFSLQERARDKTERDVQAAQPRIDALVGAGLSKPLATLSVLGKGGASIAVSGDALTKSVTSAQQKEILDLRSAVTALNELRPLIDEDTIGIRAAIARNAGAIAQQLPGVRDVANAIGGVIGMDRATVTKALVAQGQMAFTIGSVARLITRKGARLSNEDREFVANSLGLLNLATTVEASQAVIDGLLKIAERLETAAGRTLETGTVAPRGKETFITIENDDIVTRDANGEEISRIKAE